MMMVLMMITRMKMMRINRLGLHLLYAAMETGDVSGVKSARTCGVGGQVGG